jgi:hypothetical protein
MLPGELQRLPFPKFKLIEHYISINLVALSCVFIIEFNNLLDTYCIKIGCIATIYHKIAN